MERIGSKDTPDIPEQPIISEPQTSEPSERGSFFVSVADDESIIKAELLHGNGIQGSINRIYNFVKASHPTIKLALFLQHEYGTGGHIGDRDAGIIYAGHNPAGIQIRVRGDNAENGERTIKLSWNNVSERITALAVILKSLKPIVLHGVLRFNIFLVFLGAL